MTSGKAQDTMTPPATPAKESPHWAQRQQFIGRDIRRTAEDEFPYNEGLPYYDGVYELNLGDGRPLIRAVPDRHISDPGWKLLGAEPPGRLSVDTVLGWRCAT